MAFTSTSRRFAGITRRVVSAGAAIALAGGVMLAFAAPASAHVPTIKADCKDGVSFLKIRLTDYRTEQDNFVSVIIDGEVVLDDAFGARFPEEGYEVWELDPSEAHEYEVDVFAYDDPDYEKGWSVNVKGTIEACEEKPVEPTTTTEAPPVEPTTTIAVAPTSAPAGGSSGGLADTGASIAVPIVLGLLMLVGGGALLVMVRRRGDSSA